MGERFRQFFDRRPVFGAVVTAGDQRRPDRQRGAAFVEEAQVAEDRLQRLAGEGHVARRVALLEVVEKEIDERKISEFEWLSPLITRQVTDVLKLALGKPDAQVAVIEEGQSDENFIDFGRFYQQISDGNSQAQ